MRRTPNKRLVITLHGIRTFAPWQKDLSDELGKAGFNTKSLQYGYFSSLKLIWPSRRRKQIEWFREQYTHIINEYPGITPSIIAHSFGTYMVARALEIFDGIRFDHVILCGSIIPQDFSWQELFDDGQVRRVLNECARKDIVVKAAPFFIQDAGASGAYGFTLQDDNRLCQRTIRKFGHSDYLYVLNFKEVWIPFLKGGNQPRDRLSTPPFNWRIWISKTILLLLLTVLGVSGVRTINWLRTKNYDLPNDQRYSKNITSPAHEDAEKSKNINKNGLAPRQPTQRRLISPTGLTNKARSAESYFVEARRYFTSGNCKGAVKAIQNATSRDPQNSTFHEYQEIVTRWCAK